MAAGAQFSSAEDGEHTSCMPIGIDTISYAFKRQNGVQRRVNVVQGWEGSIQYHKYTGML